MSAAGISVHAAGTLDPDCRAEKHFSCISSAEDCRCVCHEASTATLDDLYAQALANGEAFDIARLAFDEAGTPEMRRLALAEMDLHIEWARRVSRDIRIVTEALVYGVRRG